MGIFAFSLAVVSGLCLGTGLLHLFIGLRRRGSDMKHLTFALFALAYAGAVLFGLLMYRATSLGQYLVVDRWSGVFAGLTHIFLVWFVAIYTGEQPLPFLAALTLLFATVIAAHVTRPTLIHGQIIGLASVTLPWAEQIQFLEAAESAWDIVFLVTLLLTIGFLFFACFRQYRRGERGAALALGAGLLLFVGTLVVDVLVESGAVDFVLASDFGFLPLAIVMSLQMSNAVIRTEEELSHYRRRLELLVDERTTELQGVNEQLAQANEELAALNYIAQTLSTVTDLPAALERVSEMLTRLFSASHTFVVLPTGEGGELQILTGYGRKSGPIEITPLPVLLKETSYARRVLIEGTSLTLSDIQSLPLAAPVNEFLTTQNIFGMALVPLMIRGAAMGVLLLALDQMDRVFTPDEVRLAETIAAEIAGALENARLAEQAQVSAVDEERGRIARDLHDSVTQTVYSASLIAEALPRVWEREPSEVKPNLTALLQLIKGALAEMRTLLFELRPAALEEASLDRLLHQLADVLTGRTRTPVEVTIQGRSDVGREVKISLYRIAQEAFNNIAKHAGATRVIVTLQTFPDWLILAIRDDGRGFDPDLIPAGRMGVRIMRERAEAIGAEFSIESQVGQGTGVSVVWRVAGYTS